MAVVQAPSRQDVSNKPVLSRLPLLDFGRCKMALHCVPEGWDHEFRICFPNIGDDSLCAISDWVYCHLVERYEVNSPSRSWTYPVNTSNSLNTAGRRARDRHPCMGNKISEYEHVVD